MAKKTRTWRSLLVSSGTVLRTNTSLVSNTSSRHRQTGTQFFWTKMPPLRTGGLMTRRHNRKSYSFTRKLALSRKRGISGKLSRSANSQVFFSRINTRLIALAGAAARRTAWRLWWSTWTSSPRPLRSPCPLLALSRLLLRMCPFLEDRQNPAVFLAGEKKVLKSTRNLRKTWMTSQRTKKNYIRAKSQAFRKYNKTTSTLRCRTMTTCTSQWPLSRPGRWCQWSPSTRLTSNSHLATPS